MSETQHTPGPWMATGPYKYSGDVHPSFKIDASTMIIATVYLHPTIGDANARLIALAPEMLAALIQVTSRADDDLKKHFRGRTDKCSEDYAKCVDLIARATGTQS